MSTHYTSLARRTSPDILALFPLNGTVLLPACELPLNVFEPRYLNMIDDALRADRLIGMIQTHEHNDADAPQSAAPQPATPQPATPQPAVTLKPIGGMGRITQFSEMDDGRYLIVLKGLKRFRFLNFIDSSTPYQQARISFEDFEDDAQTHSGTQTPNALSGGTANDRSALILAMKSFAKSLGVSVDWDSLAEIPLSKLVNQAAMISPFKAADKQSLLEAHDTNERRRLLIGLMHLYASSENGTSRSSMQ